MRFKILAAAAALALAGPAVAQSTDPVGVMTAFQTLVSRAGVTLAVGSGVFLGDTLVSNETGLGMIVFDDESSAKIGPNASLIIDSFVYDPSTGNGSSNITLNSGLVRLYGGQLSHDGNMQVTTPHVVLGMRGGIVEISTGPDGTVAILRAGQLTCIVGNKIIVISNPGFGCASDGEELTTQEFDAELYAILDSLDEIAGGGVPGSPGGGFDTQAICGTSVGAMLTFCQGADGGQPGGGQSLPDNPMAEGNSCGYCMVEYCEGDYCWCDIDYEDPECFGNF